MPDLFGSRDGAEPVTIELSPEELDDLISHLRTGTRLRPGQPRQQRLIAKLRGFGTPRPTQDDDDTHAESTVDTVCPLERDTPDDVSWLADWVHGRLHELTDGDEHAVVWKQAHLVRFLLGRLHDWLEESDYPTAAMTAFQAEALVAHVARYLEHVAECRVEAEPQAETEDGSRSR